MEEVAFIRGISKAKRLNFDAIEIPAAFIKNKTEVKLTRLPIGEFLTREAISKLYKKPNLSINIPYIFCILIHKLVKTLN